MGQASNVIGCWRAHMNVFQKMVHEKVSSALIFEDDADWDVALKEQLVQFARGSRFITNTSEDAFSHSPYGNDWDMLWIGHCGTWVLPDDNRRFFVIPDVVRNRLAYKSILTIADDKLESRIRMFALKYLKTNTHSLRYALISYLAKNAVDPAIIAKVTGHKDLKRIVQYTQIKDAVEILRKLAG